MANKALFKSLIGRLIPATDVINEERVLMCRVRCRRRRRVSGGAPRQKCVALTWQRWLRAGAGRVGCVVSWNWTTKRRQKAKLCSRCFFVACLGRMLLGLHHTANVPLTLRDVVSAKLVGPFEVMANAGVEYTVTWVRILSRPKFCS